MPNEDYGRRRMAGTFALVGFVGICIVVAVSFFRVPPEPVRNSTTDGLATPTEVAGATQTLPPPPIGESVFVNTGPDARYVGKRKCAECHREIVATFDETMHNHSLSPAKPLQATLPDATIKHSHSGYEYQTATRDGQLVQTEAVVFDDQSDIVRETPMDYLVGSGQFGHTPATTLDGFLVQSPLTWYSTRTEWDMSPGYDQANQISFRRAVSAKCLYCHCGHVEVLDQNEFDFQIHEMAISCERCHGPGSEHVKRHETSQSFEGGRDNTIVNPAHLEREAHESICQQCHLQGNASTEVRGREFDSFRPGLLLKDFRQDYRLQHSTGMTIVGHVEQMHLSPCYLNSDSLTCTTCHDPHRRVTEEKRVSHYRAACLKCHESQTCPESMDLRLQKEGDSCIACHMPAADTELPHVAFTHHRIGLHPHQPQYTEPEVGELISMIGDDHLPAADRDRCRGLAWLHLYQTHEGTPEHAKKSAQTFLENSWNAGCRDAEVAAGLCRIAFEIGWGDGVQLWATRALEIDAAPTAARMSALKDLAEWNFSRNQFEEALNGFVELTKHNRDARHWFYRGLSEQNLGQTDKAIASLKKSIEINPRNQGASAALAAIFQAIGDIQQRDEYQTLARKLQQAPP